MLNLILCLSLFSYRIHIVDPTGQDCGEDIRNGIMPEGDLEGVSITCEAESDKINI